MEEIKEIEWNLCRYHCGHTYFWLWGSVITLPSWRLTRRRCSCPHPPAPLRTPASSYHWSLALCGAWCCTARGATLWPDKQFAATTMLKCWYLRRTLTFLEKYFHWSHLYSAMSMSMRQDWIWFMFEGIYSSKSKILGISKYFSIEWPPSIMWMFTLSSICWPTLIIWSFFFHNNTNPSSLHIGIL